ncbi:hypothetical protein BLNAU_17289 [Blattamonas nauphoetae]|uniref:Uncharacterized protein n=1 Tax=Blattamonas nauphoetae TaxID=2049346 RepID=A0ABQ9XC38_9EUKA|nr:hypothetical protein BLNAU_17289 [Blattamonas nauphoetae]
MMEKGVTVMEKENPLSGATSFKESEKSTPDLHTCDLMYIDLSGTQFIKGGALRLPASTAFSFFETEQMTNQLIGTLLDELPVSQKTETAVQHRFRLVFGHLRTEGLSDALELHLIIHQSRSFILRALSLQYLNCSFYVFTSNPYRVSLPSDDVFHILIDMIGETSCPLCTSTTKQANPGQHHTWSWKYLFRRL